MKELTLEELEKQYKEAEENCKAARKAFEEKKKEEDDRKKAILELEKETRKIEIEAAENHLNELISSYIKDYGSYSTTRCSEGFPNILRMFL